MSEQQQSAAPAPADSGQTAPTSKVRFARLGVVVATRQEPAAADAAPAGVAKGNDSTARGD